jgi:hypothetical protein
MWSGSTSATACTPSTASGTYQELRRAADATGHNVAVVAELHGPKIRFGRLGSGPPRVAHWRPDPDHRRCQRGDHDQVQGPTSITVSGSNCGITRSAAA